MSRVDGAVVTKTVATSGRKNVGVLSMWSGGEWQIGSHATVKHFRGRLPIGVWQIDSVEVLGRAKGTVVWLTALKRYATIGVGDVLVLGDGAYTTLRVDETDLPESDVLPVVLGKERYHALLRRTDGGNELLVFHQPDASMGYAAEHPIWYREREYHVRLPELRHSGLGYQLEVRAEDDTIPIKWLVKVLGPIRGFALDAGQELLFQRQRTPGGRRLGATYTNFDPLVGASAGSLRLSIHPASPEQIPLFVSPDEPLRRLGTVLEKASRGDAEAMVQSLSEDLFSTDSLLTKVRQFTDVAVKLGGLSIRTPSAPDGFVIAEVADRTVAKSIASLETRVLERLGLLYGLDTKRGWCRVMSEGPEGAAEDWTLRFDEELADTVSGRVPREVSVVFETQAPPEVSRGTGRLHHMRYPESDERELAELTE